MKSYLNLLLWQLKLLQRNNIIIISFAVTLFYAGALWALRDLGNLDKVLTVVILNDPATIGFFFMGLAISAEYKSKILSALLVTPLNHHAYITTKVLALSIIGLICALAIAYGSIGFTFKVLPFTIGVLHICIITALLGLIIIGYTMEFLKFSLYSIPVFILFVNIPILDYLNAYDFGWIKYLVPIESGLQLIIDSYGNSNARISLTMLSYGMSMAWIALFYFIAFKVFENKIVKSSL